MANDEIKLAYEETHIPELQAAGLCSGHFLEENAFGVLGESGDYDVMLTYLAYEIGGRAWGVESQKTRLTSFMAVPKSWRGTGMHDNDFISNRVDPVFCTGTFARTMSEDSYEIDINGQKLISRPPVWELKGEPHNGVKVDCVFTANGPASWSLGHYEDIAQNGMAGYDQGLTVTGSITANGVEYKLDPGCQGNREYVTIGDKWINGDLLKRYSRHAYCFVSAEGAEAFIWNKEAMGMNIGRTVIDGNSLSYNPDEITWEETDHWLDPRTHILMPCKCHATMKNENGYADLYLASYARYPYSFAQKDGIITYINTLTRCDGEICQNGKKVEFKDARTQLELGIYTLPLGVG